MLESSSWIKCAVALSGPVSTTRIILEGLIKDPWSLMGMDWDVPGALVTRKKACEFPCTTRVVRKNPSMNPARDVSNDPEAWPPKPVHQQISTSLKSIVTINIDSDLTLARCFHRSRFFSPRCHEPTNWARTERARSLSDR